MPLQPDPAESSSLYECVECRERTRDPDGRRCACGGHLRNIGVPRHR